MPEMTQQQQEDLRDYLQGIKDRQENVEHSLADAISSLDAELDLEDVLRNVGELGFAMDVFAENREEKDKWLEEQKDKWPGYRGAAV